MAFNEFDIYQNRAIGAHVIWEFTKSYYLNAKQDDSENSYPTILHTLPVLPLCFNARVVDGIWNRKFKEGGIIKALNENKDLFSGLQNRMEKMSTLTFQSIYLAHSSKLIHFDREYMVLVPLLSNFPSKIDAKLHKDYKDILASSRRIGFWFSKLSLPEVLMYFNINF